MRGDCRKGTRAPQDESRLELVACRLAKARQAKSELVLLLTTFADDVGRYDVGSPRIASQARHLIIIFPIRPPLFLLPFSRHSSGERIVSTP